MNARVYLDYNATAPIRPEASAAVLRALEIGGNPSSIHAAGRAARAAIEEAREAVAALAGAQASQVVFTSGGAEANTLAMDSGLRLGGGAGLIVGATEHASISEAAEVSPAMTETWPVGGDGIADISWLGRRLDDWKAEDGRPFVALMLANNETGVIQPVMQAAEMVREAGGWLHVDAVQAAGKIAVDMVALGADTLALSAHKLGGPQGSGALIVGPRVALTKRNFGGGQERGRRGGTENLSGIAGFGAAARATHVGEVNAAWRDAAAERLKREAGVTILGEAAQRLPNTLCFAAEGYASELQVMALDLAGVMVSAGSACSSGKVKGSHVVKAMGRADLAGCALRVSGGWASTRDDWERFVEAWLAGHARHLVRRPALVEA